MTAQPIFFPAAVPANTIMGRLGIGPGRAEAIPFDLFTSLVEADIIDAVTEFGTSFANVKRFGAVGDGVTNDATAIQAAINSVSSTFNSGFVYFPPGNPYLVNSTIIVPSSVTLLGSGVGNCSIMARNDITVLLVSGDYAQIQNLTVIGKGSNNDIGVFGATQPAVQMDGVEARMTHARVQGGAPCIRVTKDDTYLDDVTIISSYGISIITIDAVCFMSRCKIDQAWPVSQPPVNTTFAARANNTPYLVGAVVSMVGPDSNTWYIQCRTAGTSHLTTPPTLKNYGQDISDGSVIWQLVARSDMDCIRISGNEFHGTSTDISSVGRFGILVNGAIKTFIHQFIIGQQWGGSIKADSAGSSLYVNQCELGVGLNPNTFAVQTGSWAGDLAVTNCTVDGAIGTGSPGIDLANGVDARIIGNYFKNCDTGVQVRPNITDFIVSTNSFKSCTTSVQIQSGTGNHFAVVNNLLNTSGAISDASTGVFKTISGNDTSPVPNVQTGATYTVVAADTVVVANRAGTVTLTLPTASSNKGRLLTTQTIQAQTVVSATSNVVPQIGGAAGTAILAATAGKWADMISDGTNWIITRSN